MVTKLSMWKIGIKKWRRDNKLNGPEWDMINDNRIGMYYVGLMFGTPIGICIGFLLGVCII